MTLDGGQFVTYACALTHLNGTITNVEPLKFPFPTGYLLSQHNMHITYQLEPNVSVEEFLDVLERSTLAARRPVGEDETIKGMLSHAGVIVTARVEGELVGISRAITDFSYCTYLSDLAVAVDFQRRGIGRELIRRTHEAAGLNTALILLAAPQAESYYPQIGMQPHHCCWTIARQPAPSA